VFLKNPFLNGGAVLLRSPDFAFYKRKLLMRIAITRNAARHCGFWSALLEFGAWLLEFGVWLLLFSEVWLLIFGAFFPFVFKPSAANVSHVST